MADIAPPSCDDCAQCETRCDCPGCVAPSAAAPVSYTDTDVELVATATAGHHIEFGRTDATGNNPCVCGQWWDSADEPGWDEHMAEVALSALATAGRLLPVGHRYVNGDIVPASADTEETETDG